MEKVEAILLLVSCVLSIVLLVYQIIQFVVMKKLQMKSNRLLYVKRPDFVFMKNAGEDPCDIKAPFSLPTFSQNCDYLIK